MAEAPLKIAKAMSVDVCEHGRVSFFLHGEDGKPFAVGYFNAADTVTLILDLTERIEAYQDRRDAFPPCQGHA